MPEDPREYKNNIDNYKNTKRRPQASRNIQEMEAI